MCGKSDSKVQGLLWWSLAILKAKERQVYVKGGY